MKYSHMQHTVKPIVALLTFSIGVAVSLADVYAAVVFSPVTIFLLFHLLLFGGVVHQLVVRANNRSQVIGKGVLAEVVWLVASFIVVFITLDYMMSFSREDAGTNSAPLPLVVIGATSVSYALVGWGLFRWARNPENEGLGIWEREHWRSH